MEMLHHAVSLCHMLLRPYLQQAHVVVDMTCGNGKDTVFLKRYMQDGARLYAFDIQPVAIARTKERLLEAKVWDPSICLRCGSHEQLVLAIEENIDICVFNLGYLPKGNHDIQTTCDTTIKAIKFCLHKLSENGIIMVAAYPGTPIGKEEALGLASFLQKLPQSMFHVSLWKPLNQIHEPPILYIIQKRKTKGR